MVHSLALIVAVNLALGAAAPLTAQPAPQVTKVAASRSGSVTTVTIGLMPGAQVSEPRLLEQPWRIYFDITGVRPGSRRLLEVGEGPVSRVRLALNQPVPAVTRVVIDLAEKAPWRMERADGDVRVVIGSEMARAADTRVDAAATPGKVIYVPPGSVTPAVDRRAQIRVKLFAMAPAVDAIRTWNGPSDGELAALIAESEELATGARAMTVSGSAADQALVAAIDAVAAAARARARAIADGTEQSRANAISAASGALLLLDHSRNVNGKS